MDDQKIATVTLNAADRSVNVFDEELLREMASVITQFESQSDLKLVVFRSSKPAGFLAGADVPYIHSIKSADVAEQALLHGQQLFDRVARLHVPTIAVIHGPCLGGGLEFAMSCQYRIAIDAASTRLGLPETQLGLIPGWGGTQRLPAIVGLTQAMTMILEGSQLSVKDALKAGLIDAVASSQNTEPDVRQFAEKCLSSTPPKPRGRSWWKWLIEKTSPGQAILLKVARRKIARRGRHYPALSAALNAIETGLSKGPDVGFKEERSQFCSVLFKPATRNLLELFFQRERARKVTTWVSEKQAKLAPIETIAVIGGGTMGAGIAQLALTRGYRVVLKELNAELAAAGEKRVTDLISAGVRKGVLGADAAESARRAFTATTEWTPVCDANLVIEAIVEKLDIKQQLFRELDARLPENVILASNTSALPITELGNATARPDRVAGLHFFNPVHKMPLVEVVQSRETSQQTLVNLLEFTRALGKTPLLVAEGPGFLVNRVLFSYLDEAVRLVLDGVSVSDVDREAKRFGLPMGPLELMDTVGLDIAADVASTLSVLDTESSPTAEFLNQLLREGRKGQKSGSGFYTYPKGKRGAVADLQFVPNPGAKQVSSKRIGDETFSGVQLRLVGSLINAAAQTLSAGIVREPWMVDLGMVLGTGFPPFRGGPLRLAETWGYDVVCQVLKELAETLGPRFTPDPWLTNDRTRQETTNPASSTASPR
ncbi:MAG TPA: 3-hydroxyacyl-CoA dehydrogenase NAD-binding domain-containing protein [Planctomycetaceae bacterium]|nr:3-hydroxyacyl-CoA dehydrogenase NAD-binding domain-containing protein [Planctomycetaceae bacterium]HQZ66950.1 3-hydroxyacyl-CoA dehydrogenase NAD-binding domain-containing protein [Planctomycetaceae bacterium]HRA87962.1 3-hydroxyacyl-CoA dehydrogenase NAD-binding domain-containing protein [Planctomycetaceae bacterium]